MNTKKISILLIVLLAWAMNTLAQSEKPQLTLVRNPHTEMQGGLANLNQPIVYKDKLYMGYSYEGGRNSVSLVTFDGQKWISSIYKDKNGKIVGDNYSYSGNAVIYQDLLFMVFKVRDNDTYLISYTDGKKFEAIMIDIDYVHRLISTPDKLYIVCNNRYDSQYFLWTYDGKTVSKLAALPSDANYHSIAYYKGKVRINGNDKIYTLTGNSFSSTNFPNVNYTKPVIWKGELCYIAKKLLKEPCSDKEGKLIKEGYRMSSFDGEKENLVYFLAKNHINIRKIEVIDGNLYSTQQNCETGKFSFCISKGDARAVAYPYTASCRGNFIKYQNSIFVGYNYYNEPLDKPDDFLTYWTLDTNNKLACKKIKDDCIYIDGKADKTLFIRYVGFPVVFKNKLYVVYSTNNDTYKTYLMKYIP